MDSRSQAKKREQLGMSCSTATYRLQRMLLFQFAQQLGQDICFRCGKRIETIREFTVEHKKPWLDVSPDLFWDLSNVAFSHCVCNSGATRRTEGALRASRLNGKASGRVSKAPKGTAWCAGHKDYVVVENFHSNKRNASEYASYCKDCRQQGYTAGVGL